MKPGLILLILVFLIPGCAVAGEEAVLTEEVSEQEPLLATPTSAVNISTPVPTQNEIKLSPAVNEQRLLTLEWPARIRVGDADVIRLTLEVSQEGSLTPTAIIAGHELRGEVISIPNIYDTHNVIAAARLDIASMQVIPNDLIEQPLLPGEKVDYFWSVSTDDIGTYRGTVWLYLRFLPFNGGEETQKALSAQVLEINSVNIFGLGGTPARVLGSIGIVVGALLGMDDILMILNKGYRYIRKDR